MSDSRRCALEVCLANEYQHDIFISYKRGGWSEDWVLTHLVTQLTFWVGEEYEREPKIFVDQSDIATGADWSETITTALWQSRVLVSVWTGRYFRSTWCKFEWEYFRSRSKSVKQPLVFPLLLAGKTQLPANAEPSNCIDLTPYALTSIPKETALFMGLEGELKALSKEIAERLRSVPPLSPDWSVPIAPAVDLQQGAGTIRRQDVAL